MNPRRTAAILAAKAAGVASRRVLRRGGTALPGLVAERIDPGLVRALGSQLDRTVLVTGTNGKTTTARLLAAILQASGMPALHNREGSNLTRGIASALVQRSSVGGRVRDGAATTGLFETDEATLPAATKAFAPRAIVFTNLFRDQLDRYGEVDTVAGFWRRALASAPADCTLILNADDPSVAELSIDWRGPVHWFGIDDAALPGGGGAFDARWCRVCGADFAYERRYFAHIGVWRCDGCGRKRPAADTTATGIDLALDGAAFEAPGLGRLQMPMTGLYNVWNALAAIAAARVLGIGDEAIRAGLAAAEPAFGRQETVEFEGRSLHLLLVKNPAGANQVVQLLASLPAPLNVAFFLNDRFADGQDVSWTWDVDFEPLAGRVAACWAGGDRGADAALRLQYAGWPAPVLLPPDPGAALDRLVATTRTGERVMAVLTYTALLDLRRELGRRGATSRSFA